MQHSQFFLSQENRANPSKSNLLLLKVLEINDFNKQDCPLPLIISLHFS